MDHSLLQLNSGVPLKSCQEPIRGKQILTRWENRFSEQSSFGTEGPSVLWRRRGREGRRRGEEEEEAATPTQGRLEFEVQVAAHWRCNVNCLPCVAAVAWMMGHVKRVEHCLPEVKVTEEPRHLEVGAEDFTKKSWGESCIFLLPQW